MATHPRFGLCDSCVHQQLVRTTRGSTFSLCRRSREQPEYPRYPRVPVLECAGWEPHKGERTSSADGDPDAA